MRKAIAVVLIWAVASVAQDEKRDKSVEVPLTKAERAALEKAAKEAHLDVEAFVRSRLMRRIEGGTEPKEADTKTEESKPEKAESKDNAPSAEAGEGKEIIPGWVVVSGDWTEKDGIVSTTSGQPAYLSTKDNDILDFELKGAIRYQRIYKEFPYQVAAVFLRFAPREGALGYHFSLNFSDNTVLVQSHTPLKGISPSCAMPMARNVWIPFDVRVTGKDATILVGKTVKTQAKLEGKESAQPRVGLHAHGAEVDFRITKLRVTRRAGSKDKVARE